jgi:hypothetical protein
MGGGWVWYLFFNKILYSTTLWRNRVR